MSLAPRAAARGAVASNPDRPATAVLLDSPQMRLVVFRIAPGQAVPPHRSTSAVTVTVLEGSGILSGEQEEVACDAGGMVSYSPNELHGMRATTQELLLLACIAPRPGARQIPSSVRARET